MIYERTLCSMLIATMYSYVSKSLWLFKSFNAEMFTFKFTY